MCSYLFTYLQAKDKSSQGYRQTRERERGRARKIREGFIESEDDARICLRVCVYVHIDQQLHASLRLYSKAVYGYLCIYV